MWTAISALAMDFLMIVPISRAFITLSICLLKITIWKFYLNSIPIMLLVSMRRSDINYLFAELLVFNISFYSLVAISNR